MNTGFKFALLVLSTFVQCRCSSSCKQYLVKDILMRLKPQKEIWMTCSVLVLTLQAVADTAFTSRTAWENSAGTHVTIDFESVNGQLLGNEFALLPKAPTFSSSDEIWVQDSTDLSVPGNNVLAIQELISGAATGGIGTVTFQEPVTAIGASFVDVEPAFASTGFDIDKNGSIEHGFSTQQGNGTRAFIGIVFDVPITSFNFHLNSQVIPDGVGFDDFVYTTASDADADADADGVIDSSDNCTLLSNPDQRDTNNDGFGNLCDPDLNNDQIVNFVDIALFSDAFLSTGPNQDADFNGDDVVNFLDFTTFMDFFLSPPGPAGLIE